MATLYKYESKPDVTCKMPWYPTRKNVRKNAIFLMLLAVNLRVIQWSLKLELSISDFISVGRSHAWLPLMGQLWTGSGRVCRTMMNRGEHGRYKSARRVFWLADWRRWINMWRHSAHVLSFFIAVIGKLKARILAIGQDFPFRGFLYSSSILVYLTNSNTVHQHIV